MDIVNRIQPVGKQLTGLVKVSQIRTRIVLARVASTSVFDRGGIFAESRVGDVKGSVGGKKLAVARVPGRHNAIEHVRAERH